MCQVLQNKPHLLQFPYFEDARLDKHDKCFNIFVAKLIAPPKSEIWLFFMHMKSGHFGISIQTAGAGSTKQSQHDHQ